MLITYLQSAYRNLVRQPVSSTINIIGLSIAIASCIVIYLFLQIYYSLDTSHEHADRIFMIEHVVRVGDKEETWGTTPMPLGPLLESDIPQVERAVRVLWMESDVRTAEATFDARVGFVDLGFFEMFTFPLQAGTASLTDPGVVILGDETARKYFGADDPVGRSLVVSFGDAPARVFTVGGVASPFPLNAALRFDLLVSIDVIPGNADVASDDWSASVDATFIQVMSPDDIREIAAQMSRYIDRWNLVGDDEARNRFVFENLADPAPFAHEVIRRPTEAPHPAFSLIMVVLGGLMMALACFNYVNISLGSATRRLNEIAVRKVMGGTKRQLVAQFMLENLLLCAIAMALGVLLAHAVFIPIFNNLFVIEIALSPLTNLQLWLFLACLLGLVGLASGAYPAFYVSSFRPALIFRGKQRPAEKRWLTRTLMTGQFVIAFLAVHVTVLLMMNGRYLLKQEWGYEPGDLLVVKLSDSEQFTKLRDAAAGQASVSQVAGSRDHIGMTMGRTIIGLDDATEYEAMQFVVGPGYAEAVGLRLDAGRFFDERIADDAESVVINRRMVRELGWADPLAQTITIEGRLHRIVGVTEDFLYDPVVQPQPALLRFSVDGYRYLTLRLRSNNPIGIKAFLESQWRDLAPDIPLESFEQRSVFADQYESYGNLARTIGYLAGLALLIACMGVFGLASQNVALRMKEVSVRKVMGASVVNILYLVNRVFVVILALAAGIATTVSLSGVSALLSMDVANFMPLTPLPFLLSYLIVFLTMNLSVASQSLTLLHLNPAETLRSE